MVEAGRELCLLGNVEVAQVHEVASVHDRNSTSSVASHPLIA